MALFSRRHYEALASLIREKGLLTLNRYQNLETCLPLMDLIHMLEKDNPAFIPVRFYARADIATREVS